VVQLVAAAAVVLIQLVLTEVLQAVAEDKAEQAEQVHQILIQVQQ
jgi:hypothetical protein